jgi:hypothetical protein
MFHFISVTSPIRRGRSRKLPDVVRCEESPHPPWVGRCDAGVGVCPCAVLRRECEGTLLGRRRVKVGLNGVPTVRRQQQSSQSMTRKIQTDVDASNYGESRANT